MGHFLSHFVNLAMLISSAHQNQDFKDLTEEESENLEQSLLLCWHHAHAKKLLTPSMLFPCLGKRKLWKHVLFGAELLAYIRKEPEITLECEGPHSFKTVNL